MTVELLGIFGCEQDEILLFAFG